MKQIIVSILAFLYIVTSSGVTMYKHYCMGEYIELGLSPDNTENCSGCGMKESESKGCCDTQQKRLKIDNIHWIGKASYQLPVFILSPLTAAVFETGDVGLYELRKEPLQITSTFLRQSLLLFILNCHFRI